MKAPKANTKPRELVPEGNHVARLYGITYIGEINTGFKDDEGDDKWQHKVRLTWELPNEMRKFEKDGEEKELPMNISREVTFSLYKSEKQTSVLRTIANSLIGTALKDEEAENFDIDDLLGRACMVEVSHEVIESTGNKFAKAVGFGSIPKGLTVPEQINENRILNINTATLEEIEAQPEFIKDKMRSSKEFKKRFGEDKNDEIYEGDDDIPELTDEDVPLDK